MDAESSQERFSIIIVRNCPLARRFVGIENFELSFWPLLARKEPSWASGGTPAGPPAHPKKQRSRTENLRFEAPKKVREDRKQERKKESEKKKKKNAATETGP